MIHSKSVLKTLDDWLQPNGPIPNSGRYVNDMINSLETITYYKHHYVRKTGLKKAIKALVQEAQQKLIDELIDGLPEKRFTNPFDKDDMGDPYDVGSDDCLAKTKALLEQKREEIHER